MTLPYPFSEGIHSALHSLWTLTLKTPMVIRHGSSASYKNNYDGYKKGRGQEKEFSWKEKETGQNENTWTGVADFNFQFSIGSDGELTVDYSIPPSSIRGALRQWAIKQMVHIDQRAHFQSPNIEGFNEEEKESFLKQISEAREYVADTGHNWHHILSLFGNTFDFMPEELEENEPMTWAGRLKITTIIKPGIIEEESKEEYGSIDGIEIKHMPTNAPDNIQRHINVRNPLDRMTMGAKNQGLHHALEMSPEQVFDVELHILNPNIKDIEMLELWEDDINDGFLRFGGLTSQGRGRCMLSRVEYNLYASVKTALADQIVLVKKQSVIDENVFDGFWSGATFTMDELKNVFENIGKSSHVDESQS